jgi:aspartyl-tRNA(Asn)/glutamyl-tRNA(Gln) amidotransferase subunit A
LKVSWTSIRDLGVEIVDVDAQRGLRDRELYYIHCPLPEASSNLARFDGVRSRISCGSTRPELHGRCIAKRAQKDLARKSNGGIMLGTYVLSAGYYDAYYRKAQQVRTLIKNDFWKHLTTATRSSHRRHPPPLLRSEKR